MRLFLFALLGLIVAVALAVGMQHDPGYILLAWGQTTVEMSFWVGAAVQLLIVVAVIALFFVLRRGAIWSDKLGALRSERRQRRLRDKTQRGLVAYAEGRWAQARKLLSEGSRAADAGLINHLLAARASQQLGESKIQRQHLVLAAKAGAGAELASAITEAELLLESGEPAEARAVLANTGALRSPAVLMLMVEILRLQQDWSSLLELLPELRKQKLLSAAELEALEFQALQGNLHKLAVTAELEPLRNWWRGLPRHWQAKPALLAEYVSALAELQQGEEALRLLEQGLKQQWDRMLLNRFSELAGAGGERDLRLAESWLGSHPKDADLLLVLGRLCLKAELWGKARDYFESAQKVAPRAESALELARLYHALGESEKSRYYAEQGLSLSGQGLPVLPLPRS